MRTALTDLLGIDLPIIQAPIGSATVPALAAAVSEAGGLGTVALSALGGEGARSVIRATRAATGRPFLSNFVLAFPVDSELDAALDEGVPAVSFFWGDPGGRLRRAQAAGAKVFWTVGSLDEAKLAADAGADVLVAQGYEAGGHVRGTIATLPLVPQVVDAVAPLPVVAAGGIADGRGLAAVLALGAAGAWMGTRFVASLEADVHPHYRGRVIGAPAADSIHSAVFDGTWPDAPARTLRNSTLAAWEAAGRPAPGARPGEGEVLARGPGGREVLRYEAITPTADLAGDIEALSLWAGQGVGLVKRAAPAAEIVSEIAAEARRVLMDLGRRAGA